MTGIKIPNYEDALKMLIGFLRVPNTRGGYTTYGYDIYLPASVITYLNQQSQVHDAQEVWNEWSPVFYEAAWELCRRGILRPGIKRAGEQATNDGNAGNGYSVTPFGKRWLEEADRESFVPTEPERFGKLLEKYKLKFGAGYHERGQEATRCYGAHAYLACCVMCGAAAESILLSAVIAKKNQEQDILKLYSQSNGRHKVEALLLGQSRLQEKYRSYSDLLKYWRDYAAHGRISNIKEEEAFTSLALLLRFAMFVNDNWSELTA